MNPLLEVIGLEKQFPGCRALTGVDMTIPQGHIVGLLGPNSSGKTTLLKTIAGLLVPSAGQIRYYEDAVPGTQTRAMIGFCPDTMTFPRWMRVSNAFKFFEEMYPDYSEERADELCNILELKNVWNSHVRTLSKGMKERLALGLTFSRKTKLYMLDEPLDGIDPVGKMRVIDAILAMQPEDSSTLISTHLVKDIERILDSVHFLSKGRVVYSGVCDDIRETSGKTVEQMYLEVFIREGSI